ncbi:MAG: hypothetical protein D3916_19030 [Candidatus Electrothrix sp. MAN1_4]|nr:hypothetical protein [Candidatus Electrothrix sp. MAN1_4]
MIGPSDTIRHLFNGIPGKVEFAARQYRGKIQKISTMLNSLFDNYNLEGFPVSYTIGAAKIFTGRDSAVSEKARQKERKVAWCLLRLN